MDPIGAVAAVLQISKNAYALGQYIHKIYEGAKRIDESIIGLANEIHALANSCGLVYDELRLILDRPGPGAAESRYDTDGRLGRCVDQQVLQCDITLKELAKIVDILWPRNTTLFERASKQIDLQNNREKLDSIRQRIRSHTDALHTVLLVVNIRIAHIAPDHATRQLPAKLDELQRSLTNIESKLGGFQRRRDSLGDGDITLVSFARDTLKSGKTLYEASLAGSVRGADSVMGGEQAAMQAFTVAEWVSTVNALRRESREGHFSDTEQPTPSVFSDDGGHTVATRSTSGGGLPLAGLDEDVDYDSDDEPVELAQATLDSGNRAFDEQKWNQAAEFLQASLKLLYKLPHKHKRQQDILGLQYRLAVCSYHTGHIDQAEAGLESLLQHEPVSDKEGVQLCDARHLLSRIYVERNKLELAREACEGTLKARSRILGKQHLARFESMALMSRICTLFCEDVLSKVYASRIPDAHRDDLLAAVMPLEPVQCPDAFVAKPTPSITFVPNSSAATTSQGKEVSQWAAALQNRPNSHGSLASLSPDLPPLGVSPKTRGFDDLTFPSSEDTATIYQMGPPLIATGEVQTGTSTITTSQEPQEALHRTIEADGAHHSTTTELPERPHRSASAPVVATPPKSPDRRTPSTSTRAQSIISLDEAQEETYLPVRKSAPGCPTMSSEPMSRQERRAVMARFKLIEPIHNLDQSICDGRQEKAHVLTNALFSDSTQVGDPATSIVFNHFNDGLRLATKSPALHLAVLFGDAALIKPLIKKGFSPNLPYQLSHEPGMRGYLTPLDLAIASRDDSIIRELVANGAVLDPPKGESPCRQLLAPESLQLWPPSEVSGLLSTLELLLSFGWPVSKGFARLHTTSSTAPTFLHQACSLSANLHDYRLPLVKFLLEEPDTSALPALASETPLHHAIRRDDLEVVDAILQAQNSFQLQTLLDKKSAHGYQPLYLAVQRATANHDLPLDIVRCLLDQGADLDNTHTQLKSRRLRPSTKTQSTARSIAMESNRQDLISLVQSVGDKRVPTPLTRARTVCDDGSMDRSTLPRVSILR